MKMTKTELLYLTFNNKKVKKFGTIFFKGQSYCTPLWQGVRLGTAVASLFTFIIILFFKFLGFCLFKFFTSYNSFFSSTHLI